MIQAFIRSTLDWLAEGMGVFAPVYVNVSRVKEHRRLNRAAGRVNSSVVIPPCDRISHGYREIHRIKVGVLAI
jgi:hypothetical protein